MSGCLLHAALIPIYWNLAWPVRPPLPINPGVNASAHPFGGFGVKGGATCRRKRRHSLAGVVDYITTLKTFMENTMTMQEELTVPQAAAFLKVSEETVRRNIRAKRLIALRRGTQWFIPREDLVIFANVYDPRTGKIRQLL